MIWIKFRISDNVLEETDWPIWKCMYDAEQDCFVDMQVENSGTYSIGGSPSPKWTLEQTNSWLNYDPTGQHPEQYNEVWVGEWKTSPIFVKDGAVHEFDIYLQKVCGHLGVEPQNITVTDELLEFGAELLFGKPKDRTDEELREHYRQSRGRQIPSRNLLNKSMVSMVFAHITRIAKRVRAEGGLREDTRWTIQYDGKDPCVEIRIPELSSEDLRRWWLLYERNAPGFRAYFRKALGVVYETKFAHAFNVEDKPFIDGIARQIEVDLHPISEDSVDTAEEVNVSVVPNENNQRFFVRSRWSGYLVRGYEQKTSVGSNVGNAGGRSRLFLHQISRYW